jgi:2-keto-3-deoxy-L-rhamnonate aldolase RhmA
VPATNPSKPNSAGRLAPLCQRLGEQPIFGTFIKIPRPEVVDVIAMAGLDFAICDMEHAQISEDTARSVLLAAKARGLPLLVRLPMHDCGLINRLLESGATGIQLSGVRSIAQVHALNQSCFYPPRGSRSVGLVQPAANYGADSLEDYIDRVNNEVLLVGQLESLSYESPIVDIARNLHVVFVGPLDLAVEAGLGASPQSVLSHPIVEEIESSAGEAGAILGIHVTSERESQWAIDRGYQYIVIDSDLGLLRRGTSSLSKYLSERQR